MYLHDLYVPCIHMHVIDTRKVDQYRTVCDGCGRGPNGYAGRVQKHHVRFSFHTEAFTKMEIVYSKSCCRSGHSALQATRRMPLWALAIALATGKNTKLFGVLDQNENGFFTYVQGSHCRHERLA